MLIQSKQKEERPTDNGTGKKQTATAVKKNLLKFLGPAFIVSVAYIDPGNFATNISAGSSFNYSLIWVLLCSNLMAVFLQIISAKLGIATEKNLASLCGQVFKKRANCILWGVSLITANATALAELLGGTLGFYLLFGIPVPIAAILTACATLAIVSMQKYGQKAVEITITVLIAVICAAYALEMILSGPDWSQVVYHTVVPSLQNGHAVLLASGMLGATVMPHVIFLHSQLVQYRNGDVTYEAKKHHLKMEKADVVIAMNLALVVNAAMVIVSAAVFFKNGIAVDTIEQAHRSLEPLLGQLSCAAFGIALLASGFSSSAVGSMAGETMTDGFLDLKMSKAVRRLITLLPALLVILLGADPMHALVLSQVVLSFALPFAVVPLLLLTGRKDVMGGFVNKPVTRLIGWFIAAVIIALNTLLLIMSFTGNV